MLRMTKPQLAKRLFLSSKMCRFSNSYNYEDGIREINQEIEDFFGKQPSNSRQQVINDSKSNLTNLHTSSSSSNDDKSLTHVDKHGKVKMVSILEKNDTERKAIASARVKLNLETFKKLKESKLKKGDVLTVSQIAGIMAAKQTSSLIPLCHNINLSKIDVDLDLEEESHEVIVRSEVQCTGSTGVEMEAMVATAIASLTVYDMCKAVDKSIEINKLRLDYKSGGKSGIFTQSKVN